MYVSLDFEDQLWEVAGFVAKDFVPYASLVPPSDGTCMILQRE